MPIPQTTVSQLPALGVPGGISRSGPKKIERGFANGVVRCGQWVVFSGEAVAHPSAAPAVGVRRGIALKNEKTTDGNYADKDTVDVMTMGHVFVDPEVSVTRDTPAFARFVVVTTEEKGALRNDAGGATGGVTITAVTAVNAGVYSLSLRRNGGAVQEFSFIADASATTAEIATGFQVAIDADANLVATNPTATTVLVVGTTITDTIEIVSLDSRLSVASNGAAFAIPAYFRTTAATGVVELEISPAV